MRSSPRPEPEGRPGVLVYGSVEEIAERVPAHLADALARIRSPPVSQAPALRGSELSGAGGAPPPGLPRTAVRRTVEADLLPPDRNTAQCRPEGGLRPLPAIQTTQRAPRDPVSLPHRRLRRSRETGRVPAHTHPRPGRATRCGGPAVPRRPRTGRGICVLGSAIPPARRARPTRTRSRRRGPRRPP